jgi:hypothetical protein
MDRFLFVSMLYFTMKEILAMPHERETIDISHNPDLRRLAEEVRHSNAPRVLRADDKDIAVVMPIADLPKRKRKRARSDADYQAFLDSAGSWGDVDTDEFLRYVYERREASSRPPVEL